MRGKPDWQASDRYAKDHVVREGDTAWCGRLMDSLRPVPSGKQCGDCKQRIEHHNEMLDLYGPRRTPPLPVENDQVPKLAALGEVAEQRRLALAAWIITEFDGSLER